MTELSKKFHTGKTRDYYITNFGEVYWKEIGNPLKRGLIKLSKHPKSGKLSFNTKGKTIQVDRLVLKTFGKGYQAGLFIEHIDNNQSNCRLDNLRWITQAEKTRKEKPNKGKLTPGTIGRLRKAAARDTLNVKVEAKRYGVNEFTIKRAAYPGKYKNNHWSDLDTSNK